MKRPPRKTPAEGTHMGGGASPLRYGALVFWRFKEVLLNRRISCFSFWSRSHVSLVSGVFCWSFWSFCPLDSCVLSSFIAAPCAPYLLVNKHAKIPLNSDVLRRFYCIVVFPAFSFAVAVVCPWFLGLFCWSFLVVFPIRFLRFKQFKAVCLAFSFLVLFPFGF